MTEFSRRRVERWTEVKAGSVYFALKQLVKEGDILEVERVRSGAFPEKSLYEITASACVRFDALQSEAMSAVSPNFYGFKLAPNFNNRLSSAQIAARARLAIEKLDSVRVEMAANLDSLGEGEDKEFDAFFMSHDQLLVEAERRWLEEVVRRFG